MCPVFTGDDIGKSVESYEGERIGVVASVAGTVAHVRLDLDVVDSAAVADRLQRLDSNAVREITADAVRLEDEAIGGERPRGLEVDPIELAGGDGAAVTPDEFSVEPDEDMDPTDAAVEPDEDMDPTDAAVEPDTDPEPIDEPRHSDAAIDTGDQSRRSDTETDETLDSEETETEHEDEAQ